MAEQIARDWLYAHGYTIREQNWRAGKTIEIDIIAELEGTMVFVEVKARKGKPQGESKGESHSSDTLTCDAGFPVRGQSALEAVDERKMNKMAKGADIFLSGLKEPYRYRLDIITVTGTPDNYAVEHYPDAFLPPLSNV